VFASSGRAVTVEEAEVLLEHFGERPVGDPLPIRETAPRPLERLGILFCEPGPQLAREPRLAHAGVAHDRDEVRLPALDRTTIRHLEHLELALSADEGLAETADAARAHERQRALKRTARHGLRLALGAGRPRLSELERSAYRADGSLAGQDLAWLRGLLQPRGDVARVAGHEGAALAWPPYNDLARVDADAKCEPACEELCEPPLHRERRVERTFGVVFLRRRRPERCHHGVARELLHRAAGPAHLGGHRVVEAIEQRA
jgi:hypothetical protein